MNKVVCGSSGSLGFSIAGFCKKQSIIKPTAAQALKAMYMVLIVVIDMCVVAPVVESSKYMNNPPARKL